MSDRTLPRSLRTIEGFGVHSFRLNNGAGDSTFVKFHWRPKLGLQSTIWDEAVKAASDAGATVKIIALKVGGAKLADGSKLAADGQLAGTPSVLFDAIAIILSAEGAKALSLESAAIKVRYPASRLENI